MYSIYVPFSALTVRLVLVLLLVTLTATVTVHVEAACAQGYVASGSTCIPDTNNPFDYFVVRVDQDLSSTATIFGGYGDSATQPLYQICPALGATAVRLFFQNRQSYLFSRVAWYPEVAAGSRHVLTGGQMRGNWDWMTEDNNYATGNYGPYDGKQVFANGWLTDTVNRPFVAMPAFYTNFDPTPPADSTYAYPTSYYTPEPNAVTNMTPAAGDFPGRLTVDVVSGYWHNSGLLYSPVYLMCERTEVYPKPTVTLTRVSLRSGVSAEYGGNWDTECARQASDGKQRAARLTTLPKELGFRTAVSQNTAVPLLPAGSFVNAGTAQARWEWLSDAVSTTAAGAAFTNGFAFPDTRLINRVFSFWAPAYPKSDAGPTATRLTYDATAGGWVNIALPATFEIACEATTTAPDVGNFYVKSLPRGWKQTTENMALMCYNGGVMGRLAQPNTAAKQAGMEYLLATYSGADANTVGVFGLAYANDAWSWVGSPQYYPDGVTPMASSGVYTNWASGYPLANVANGAVAGFSAAAGGWIHVDPASATHWVAICEPLPTSEPVDVMENIYLPTLTTVPPSGANAVMQACAANMDPVATLTNPATERALKRRLLLDSRDMLLSTVVVGGYFTDPALSSGDWVWINAWDDSKPTTFANHYASTSAPPASTVEGMYTNWATGYPSSTETRAGRFVSFSPSLDGWTNTNGASTSPVFVACQTYTMTLTEAKSSVFIVAGATNAAAPNVYRGHLDNLCPAYNGTLYEPNSILKQRALNMVATDAGRTNDALYVGGEYSGTGQSDGMWNWASSGAFTQGFSATVSTGAAVTLADRYINWQSGYPTGTLPTNGQPGNRFASSQKGMWVNAGGAALIYAACTPGPSLYNYGIKIVPNSKTTVSPTAICGEGYSPLIVSNASVQAALERSQYVSNTPSANSPLISVRYNITTGRYVWLVDPRDPATAVSSFVAGDTSDGSYQNWSPTNGLPTNSSTLQFVSNRMKEGGWVQTDSYMSPTYMACAPYAAPSDAQTSTLFLVKAPTGIAAPQTYAGSLTNLCRAYNGALFEPSSALRQDALEQAVNAKITTGMPNTTDVYIGARYYGDSATGGVWAFESSNGAASGVFTTNFGSGAIVAVDRYTGWAVNYPTGSLTTNGSPGPRFAAFRRDLNGWVNPATESTDFYAACYTTTPPETLDITVVAHSGSSSTSSEALCGLGRAPLMILNASAQAALERKLILDGIPTSATVLLGGLYDTGNSAWTWVRDLRDLSTAMSVFGSTNTSAYTDWALTYPASPASQRFLGFSASTGGWVNVAVATDAAYVACEPYVSPQDDTSKEPCTFASNCAPGLSNDPSNPGTCFKARCFVPNCDMCLSNYQTRCATCSVGYNLDKYTGTCVKPACQVSNCKSCEVSNNFMCEECASGFFLDTTTYRCRVQACQVDNCRTCAAGQSNICLTCGDGYTVNSTTGQCAEPPCTINHCDACILGDVSRCYRCHSGYALDAQQTCSTCASGFKKNSAGDCVASKLATGALVGIIVGVVAAALIIGIALFFVWLVCCRATEPVTYVMTATPEPSLVDGPILSPTSSTATTPAPVLMEEGLNSVTTKRRTSGQKLTKPTTRTNGDADAASAFPPLNLDLHALLALQSHFGGGAAAAAAATAPHPEPAQPPVLKRRASRDHVTRHAREGSGDSLPTPMLSTEPHAPAPAATPSSDLPTTLPAGSPHLDQVQRNPVFEIDDTTHSDDAPVVKVVKRRQQRKNP